MAWLVRYKKGFLEERAACFYKTSHKQRIWPACLGCTLDRKNTKNVGQMIATSLETNKGLSERGTYLLFCGLLSAAVSVLLGGDAVWFKGVGYLATFGGLFALMSLIPMLRKRSSNQIHHQSVFTMISDLLKSKQQQVILMMPVTASGHLNASMHMGGLLNQFGREAIVMDIDLHHRLLSRKLAMVPTHGIFEHLLSASLKKPYADPMSGAKILPLETALEPDKLVEFSQIIQRLPRLWSRWPNSIIILDVSQWHESYHQLLPSITHVVFYVQPDHRTYLTTQTLPRLFRERYHVPVSLVEV
jgi:hypothetical protein